MKTLYLKKNKWHESANYIPTKTENDIINGTDEKKIITTITEIREKSEKAPTEEDKNKVIKIFNEHKIEDSEIIGCSISLPKGNGIINCRVNGEHKQIRF